MMQKDSLLAMTPLFLIIAIDSMGLGILFPTLSSMIINPSGGFLPIIASNAYREIIFSVVISIFMIAWFFGAGILGDLSDMIGRKKSLAICIIGTSIGYFISGVGILEHSLFLLILGRITAGFTAGSQAIAQAAIVDLSSETHRARNIGYMLLILSVGFILGPFLGGILSDNALVSWFNFSTPLFFACLFSIINIILLHFLFQETFTHTRKIQLRLSIAITIFIDAFRRIEIRNLSIILFIFIAGWSAYFGFIAQFLIRRFTYTPMEVALFMTVMAVGFAIGFAVIVDFLANRYPLRKCIFIALLLAGLLTLLTILNPIQWLSWVASTAIGACVATAYSMLITLFSNQVDETEQGWVMGITNAIMALAFGVTTLGTGFAASLGASVPLVIMTAGMFLAVIVISFTKN